MLGRLFRMGAYAKSPKTAFTMFHPMRAAKIGAGIWLARKLLGRFSGKSKRKTRGHTTA